ncbi:MAG: hypothetical protein K1X86_15465 [Ignavibacteria bacterium]|nr:hypothetical protein [Ignavibacteria bacterium]
MRKAIFAILILIINYSLFVGKAYAQFSQTVYDSCSSAAGRFTWYKLPSGINSIEVAADSCEVLKVAFTGPGQRGKQRKDSVNVKRVYKGQTRWFLNKDNDSIGFKGAGKIYYWIDRGAGSPGSFNNAQGQAASADSNIFATRYWVENAVHTYKEEATFDKAAAFNDLVSFNNNATFNNNAEVLGNLKINQNTEYWGKVYWGNSYYGSTQILNGDTCSAWVSFTDVPLSSVIINLESYDEGYATLAPISFIVDKDIDGNRWRVRTDAPVSGTYFFKYTIAFFN